ncbi:MAG: Coenzyme F420 hydrogenase/dehydrogenase, beta subunit C-terminal domain [Candidatus Hydrothermarchaeaceae archaeon]
MMTIETFVPLMKKSKGFEELKKLVIDQGICSGCSTCAAFCERIVMDEDGKAVLEKECNMEIGAIKCNEEGTCYDVCPMVSFSKPELEKETFGDVRKDEELGYYRKIVAARSKKKEILEKAQDGGAVTSILAAALEAKLIDGAVTANRTDEWTTSADAATTKEELIKSAGTKYARTPTTMKFGKSIRDIRGIALVGTGCQTLGARRAISSLLKDVIEKTKESDTPLDFSLIGLFCFENFPYGCIKKALEREFDVKIGDITKTDITRGKFIITKKDGSTDQKPVKTFDECVPEACNLCTNFTSEFSDISVGSVGTEDGWSTVIVRSEKGETLLENAVKLGYLEVTDAADPAGIKRNAGFKQKKFDATAGARKEAGRYVPEYI